MSIYTLGPLMGPALGPIAGGYLAQTVGVKYVFVVIAGVRKLRRSGLGLLTSIQVDAQLLESLVSPFLKKPMHP